MATVVVEAAAEVSVVAAGLLEEAVAEAESLVHEVVPKSSLWVFMVFSRSRDTDGHQILSCRSLIRFRKRN